MADTPVESETKEEPVAVQEFRKEKKKREAKRQEVKVITTHVPDAPAESIADRVAEMVLSKIAAEEEEKKARPKPPPKKKEVPPPTTKSFGWC